jgi:RNA polymerase sigma-70 factor (ECF subfamily)
LGIGKAVEHLVAFLPPKERACVLLKHVFDYSLEDIAQLLDTTIGDLDVLLGHSR